MITIVSNTNRGRIRFKINGLYRSNVLKDYLEENLIQQNGFISVQANTLTGKVLIFYNFTSYSIQNIHEFILTILKEFYNIKCSISYEIEPKKEKAIKIETKKSKIKNHIIEKPNLESSFWHAKETAETLSHFGTDPDSGLNYADHKILLKKYGRNVLSETKSRSSLEIFLEQFKSLPVALLGIAAGVSILTGGIGDAIMISGVVLINASIGYVTESNSEKTINSLKTLVKPNALVMREGEINYVAAEDVSLGDILILRQGTYIAADARIIDANNLSVDESALTGESLPVQKTVTPLSCDTPLADRTNMVYTGTLVTGGYAKAVVIATSVYTEIGKIRNLVGEAEPPETPLTKQLDDLGGKLVLASGAICALIFGIGILRGYGYIELLKNTISLAVAAVPEGLPTVAATTLSLGIINMRKQKILIRQLAAVETLGSVQTVCLDKTGTITLNQMTVKEIYCKMEYIDANQKLDLFPELLRLIETVVLCNESQIEYQNDKFSLSGSATENALIYLGMNNSINIPRLRENSPIVKMIHRSQKHNIMLTIHETKNDNRKFYAMKGSPMEVLEVCQYYMKNGEILELNDEIRKDIELANEQLAGKALRVLGVGFTENNHFLDICDDELIACGKFIWLGMVGMADTIRPGIKELIDNFRKVGIDTVMITGDQLPTAYAIAKELNIQSGEQMEILDSSQLDKLDPEILKTLCKRVSVFARVTPAHKLQVVQALQRSGRVVAMTGDGINDSPALKASDVGLSLGSSGTDVAREVADVVIEDDDLQNIINAVSQGRTIYSNIRKSIHYLVSTNMSEIFLMLIGNAAGFGHPLNSMQLLWINLVSDILPGLGLALEPPEPNVLTIPPRPTDEPILKKTDAKRILFESSMLTLGSLSAMGYGVARYGIGPQANSLSFLTLTLGQLLHSLSCRSDRYSIFSKEKMPPNPWLRNFLIGSFGLQALAYLIPGLRSLLGIAPLTIADASVVLAGTTMPYLINEITK